MQTSAYFPVASSQACEAIGGRAPQPNFSNGFLPRDVTLALQPCKTSLRPVYPYGCELFRFLSNDEKDSLVAIGARPRPAVVTLRFVQ